MIRRVSGGGAGRLWLPARWVVIGLVGLAAAIAAAVIAPLAVLLLIVGLLEGFNNLDHAAR